MTMIQIVVLGEVWREGLGLAGVVLEGLPEVMTFRLSQVGGCTVPGRGNSTCEGLEVHPFLLLLKAVTVRPGTPQQVSTMYTRPSGEGG